MSTKTNGKKPVTLNLRPKIRAMGDRLAEQDHRNLGDEVQWLIEKEGLARGMSISSFIPPSTVRSKRKKRNGKPNGGNNGE